MALEEVEQVSQLILDSFYEFIAPDYSPEGIELVEDYVDPQELRLRSQFDHLAWVAVNKEKIIGMIELREYHHISLLFVEKYHHHQGVAKILLQQAITAIKENNPSLTQLTVNASRYAVPAYKKLGFCCQESEQIIQGFIYIPMVLQL
jgi:ribosomal protein S18 acetylase RimI-like enzyme